MPEGHKTRQYCPFPPCREKWWRSPGEPFTTPVHRVLVLVMGDPIDEECPGSRIRMAGNGNISPQDAAYLLRAQRSWEQEEEDQARRNAVMPTDPATGFLGFPLGKRPHGVDAKAFPARRGDPGAPDEDWKPKTTVLPPTQIGQPLGRAAVSNAHATTKQLLALTEQKLDEALGALGKLPDITDVLDGIVVQIAVHIDTAVSLAAATVGNGEGAPAAAGEMVGHIKSAQDLASVNEGGELQSALTRFAKAGADITEQIAAAQEKARQYHAALGGGS